MQSRCSRLHEMAITQRDYISAGLGQSRSSPLRGPFDPPIPLHTRQNALSVMPVTLLKRRCPDVGGEWRGRRRRAPERAGCATLWSAGDALTGPRTGDWLSGRAPRSHRGGHWFDPSIAHRCSARSEAPLTALILRKEGELSPYWEPFGKSFLGPSL